MIRKLLPEWGTPNRSPAGVPVTSPRTMTRSPATSTSLMSNFMSGMVLAKFETTLIDVAPARDIEQAVPGRDGGAGLFFGEAAHGFFLKVDARLGRPRAIRGWEVKDHTAIKPRM